MKKIIVVILAVFLLVTVLSACGSTSTLTIPPNTTDITVSTGYQPGKWTVNGYTSEWLNLSFSKGNKFKTTNESIEITKQFNEAKKQNDPYAEIIEMEFKWLDGTDTPITLVVDPLNDKTLTVKDCVAELNKESQSFYEKYKIEVVAHSEKEVTFLEETYLQYYEKTTSFGKTYERYMLCRIKDGYLIRINFYTEESKMDLEFFLSCFSTLNSSSK
ncbi:MAG: hypothetical protein J6Q30_05755 [Oscillospiraceae bacterium]|nr:hypothetical protein [Oscillospiraceae bacterium]